MRDTHDIIPPRSGLPQDLSDGSRYGGPAAFFLLKLFAAGGRDLINARTALVFRGRPFRAHPTSLFQTVQSRVQRAFLHAEKIGNSFDMRRDPIAVERTAAVENLERQKRKGTLKSVLLCRR